MIVYDVVRLCAEFLSKKRTTESHVRAYNPLLQKWFTSTEN